MAVATTSELNLCEFCSSLDSLRLGLQLQDNALEAFEGPWAFLCGGLALGSKILGPTLGDITRQRKYCVLCGWIHRLFDSKGIQVEDESPDSELSRCRTIWRPVYVIENPLAIPARNTALFGINVDLEGAPGSGERVQLGETEGLGFRIFPQESAPAHIRELFLSQGDGKHFGTYTFEVARSFYRNCFDHHYRCRRTVSGRDIADEASGCLLPKRVIHISREGTARLSETSEPSIGQYVALSYCWGEEQASLIPKLLKSNIMQLKEGINLNHVPRTIADAINVTKELGFAYIWVDSLCILQDDDEDFCQQAGLMAHIYQYATVTITSLGDRDSHSGLLTRQMNNNAISIPWMERDKDGSRHHICDLALSTVLNFASPTNGDLWKEKNESRWVSRGWTYQEELLSRRILYFGRSQIFWECQTGSFAESAYRPGDTVQYRIRNNVNWKSDFFRGLSLHDSFVRTSLEKASAGGALDPGSFTARLKSKAIELALRPEPLKALRTLSSAVTKRLTLDAPFFRVEVDELVGNYTRRQLTVETDRLVAFEGLGEAIAERTHQKYYAGLWTDTIARGLFWRSANEEATRPIPLIAPSWSWASCTGAILNDELRAAIAPALGGYNGDLKEVEFVPENYLMADHRTVKPLSLHINAHALQVRRSRQTCADLELTWAQLRDDVQLWREEDTVGLWPQDQCHLLFQVPHPGREVKIAEDAPPYRCTSCGGSIESQAESVAIDHAEHCAKGKKPVPDSSSPSSDRLLGIALFDEPALAPTNFELVLLWHSPVSLLHIDLDCKVSEHVAGDSHKMPAPVLRRSAEHVLGYKREKGIRLRDMPLLHKTMRTYYVLLVARIQHTYLYQRIGIGITFLLPQVERFGGLELDAVAKRKKIVVL